MRFNPDGQPSNPEVNRERREERTIDELLGILKGFLSEEELSESKIHFLARWVLQNARDCQPWPIDILVKRLNDIYADGRIDRQERADLRELFELIVGKRRQQSSGCNAATELPLTSPPPRIVFAGKAFVFTGKCCYGPRSKCESAIVARGGITQAAISKQIDYLVIGEIGSRDWLHTSFGRKIEAAVRLSRNGCAIRIISEEHWARCLDTAPLIDQSQPSKSKPLPRRRTPPRAFQSATEEAQPSASPKRPFWQFWK